MKAFIIYRDKNKESTAYALAAQRSFSNFTGWEPELFVGITPDTLPLWENQLPLKMKSPSRAQNYTKSAPLTVLRKKSCVMNQYRLWKKCVELDETIVSIEDDARCIRSWDPTIQFDDVLTLQAETALNIRCLWHLKDLNTNISFPHGISDINFNGMRYRAVNDPALESAHIMPGTGAYAITPTGAKKMIDVIENIGWEQSDFIINTSYVRIQIVVPSLFTLVESLNASHADKYRRGKRK